MRRLVVATMLFVVCCIGDIAAQGVDWEFSTYDRRAAEQPENSGYTLFETEPNTLTSREYLRRGYLPITFDFHGITYRHIEIFGFDLADGVTPSTLRGAALRLRGDYPADSLATFDNRCFADECYRLDPFVARGVRRRVSASAMAGVWSGGVGGHFAAPLPDGMYDIRISSGLGPSIYGNGVGTYGGDIAVAVRVQKLSLLVTCAPSIRSRRTASVDEAFELVGSQLYNPSWGVDQGRGRNANLRRECLPTIVANYDFGGSDRCRFNLAMLLRGGLSSRSALDYYNGISPYPDYYRYLPSGCTSQWAAEQIRQRWSEGDTGVVGVDWNTLRAINSLSGRAQYIVASRVERVMSSGLVAGVSGIRGRTSYRFEAALRWDNSALYKRIDDLLSADYALNIDFFQSEMATGALVYNDTAHAGTHLSEGDRTGYNYRIARLTSAIKGSVEHRGEQWKVMFNFRCGVENLRRHGLWRKSSQPEGEGVGRWYSMADCGVDIGAVRRWGEAHRLSIGAWGALRPPEYRDLYLTPETSHDTHPRASSSADYGVRIDYHWRRGAWSGDVVVGVGGSADDSEVYRYYDDLTGCYADLAVWGISTLRTTLDAEAVWHANERLTLSAALSLTAHAYTHDAVCNIYADIDGTPLVEGATTHIAGLPTGSAPIVAGRIDASFKLLRGWSVSADITTLAGRYIAPSPLYRMERVRAAAVSPEQAAQIAAPRRLGEVLMLGGRVRKTFADERASLSLSIQGVAAGDATSYAYEQMRLRRTSEGFGAAPIKRAYAMPVTALLIVSFAL